MNGKLISGVVLLCLPVLALAQPTEPGFANATNQTPTYQITERTGHSRNWSKVTWTTNRLGFVVPQTNSAYTELATGMHYLSDGQWLESSPNFTVDQSGYAIADRTQHKVTVSPNLSDPDWVVDLQMPDGRHLRSAILGLNLFDPVSGQSLTVATAKQTQAQQTAPNEITFINAFTGLKADVRIKNEIGRFHQEVLLKEKITPEQLAKLGFDAETVRLEIWTEFLSPPSPDIHSTVVLSETNQVLRAAMAEPDQVDQLLDFGGFKMVRGKTFVEGRAAKSVPVYKEWSQTEGRTFLVEAVTYGWLAPLLESLPASTIAANKGKKSSTRMLADRSPPKRARSARNARTLIAAADLPKPDPSVSPVVLDYMAVNGTLSNYTFQCDTTYAVTNLANLFGKTTIEGGTVVKFYPSNICQIIINDSNVVCQTGPYRPAIFTVKDDNSVGEAMTGSTGTPTNYYGSPDGAVVLAYPTTGTNTLRNLRFSQLNSAMAIEGGAGSPRVFNLYDLQLVNCHYGVIQPGQNVKLNVYNALFLGGAAAFYYPITSDGALLHGENLTAHNCTEFALAESGYDLENDYNLYSIALVNSLFAASGANQNVISTNCQVLATDTGIFQTVGAAGHYLAVGSPYRNAGMTNLNATLLASLRQKTTYPPIVYSNITIDVNTSFVPQAQRDADTPDLGYHYDPLDYAFYRVHFTNAIIRFETGTAIGAFGTYGMAALSGASLWSEGAPTTMNQLARYNVVQECSNTNWTGVGDIVRGDLFGGPTPAAAHFRFTDSSIPAADGNHIYSQSHETDVRVSDCQFHGGNLGILVNDIFLTNSLLERVNFVLADSSSDLFPMVRNCLFYGGKLLLENLDETTWTFRDNLFDQVGITQTYGEMDCAYNGYSLTNTILRPTNSYHLVTNVVYQTGPLGSYYQTNTSAFLQAGSTTANLVGLYHYTTQTNQVKETNSVVDIGFHYVAVDSSGNPNDDDSDGLPDYVEDANGNGTLNSGETKWQDLWDLGFKVLITRPTQSSSAP